MGTCSSVACRDCKVKRDLDKHYIQHGGVNTAKEAEEYGKYMKESFRYGTGLLLAFLEDHKGHSVVYYSEHYESLENEFYEYKEDGAFWT